MCMPAGELATVLAGLVTPTAAGRFDARETLGLSMGHTSVVPPITTAIRCSKKRQNGEKKATQ
jgi:hypothetical protein